MIDELDGRRKSQVQTFYLKKANPIQMQGTEVYGGSVWGQRGGKRGELGLHQPRLSLSQVLEGQPVLKERI